MDDIFRNIPDLLERPVIVQFSDAIDPKTKRPKYDSSITVLGELYADVNENGKIVKKPVLVSLELLPTNQKKTAVLDFAIIKSAYSKNALQQYINENSILYIDPDKKRTDSWLSLNRLQLPLGEKSYDPIRRIAYVDGKVKVQSPKNMSAMQKKLFEAGIIDEFGNKLNSDRADESVSNRSLLANAFEGLVQNDIERNKLQEYKDKIGLINAEEQKLRKLNEQIKELSFAKGPRDTKAIRDLQDEAKKTANRINIYDTQLTDSNFRDEQFSKLPALADELTWCAIWNAVKRETVSTHTDLRPGSEEFLKAAGERFTEVVTKTQVYDSVLARSANMRSKSGMMNMATSFMAEPTTTINMLEDAIYKAKRGHKGYAAKLFASVATSIVLNNALVALVYAMRDDDEDETYLEKYVEAFVSGILDDINPLTYYPFLKALQILLIGYGYSCGSYGVDGEFGTATENAVEAFQEDMELEVDGKVGSKTWAKLVGV